MNYLTVRMLRLSGALVCTAAALRAQAVSQSPNGGSGASSVVTLDPFEVKTGKDTSYGALNSNSIVRFDVPLDKTPIAADVLTHQFIEDTQVTTVEDLFNAYAGGGGMSYINETDANNSQPGDRFSEGQLSIRGMAAGVPRRDGFATGQMSTTSQNSTNVFDVERLDILHGSQGLLYGATGPGGVVNIVSKQAGFNSTKGELETRFDQYGSKLAQADANIGVDKAALRVVVLDDSNQTRRLFIGDVTKGYYSQAAFKLPLNTTLRVSAEETHNIRYIPITGSVSFAGTPFASGANADPRNGKSLAYLFRTDQLGAINPATGQPFPGGAIDNGYLNRDNLYSLTGWHNQDLVDTKVYEATIDTVWASWFSTSFGAYWNKQAEMRNPNGTSLLAPGATNNPTGDWAVSPTFADSVGPNRQKSYRANALLTKDFFGGDVKTSTSFGFDRAYQDSNSVVYKYYLSNGPNNTLVLDPTKTTLGRGSALAGATTAWSIGHGPVQYPGAKPGALYLNVNGQTWVRAPANPTNSAWVTPGNPEGLANLYQRTLGITSSLDNSENELPWAIQERDQGFYAANYSSWWNDRIQTLLGFRDSNIFTRTPNTSAPVAPPDFQETRSSWLPSYNAGLVGKLTDLPGSGALRAYYGYSRTFNVAFIGAGNSDPNGNLVPNPTGWTHEAGLKFTAFDDRLSGSFSGFVAYAQNTAINGGALLATVNPTGISGNQFQSGPTSPGNFAIYNQISRGLELMFTAQPKPNWRTRLVATLSDGTVRSNAQYPMLYNDQFYLNAAGNVTYGNNGPVVMVPGDAAGLALLAKQNSQVDMSNVAGTPYKASTLVPLTINMINDPTSAYFAFGGTGNQFSGNPAYVLTNEPLNGSIGGGTGGTQAGTTPYLKNALANFTYGSATPYTGVVGLPFSAMQYNFADPAGYKGTYIVRKQGEATVGYPEIRINLTNDYRVPSGFLQGVHAGGSIALAWGNRTYFYATPDRLRHLFSASLDNPLVNAWIGYQRRFGKVTFNSQVNVNNMFNRYHLDFAPNNGTGFTNANNIGVRWTTEPRYYVWSNTISF